GASSTTVPVSYQSPSYDGWLPPNPSVSPLRSGYRFGVLQTMLTGGTLPSSFCRMSSGGYSSVSPSSTNTRPVASCTSSRASATSCDDFSGANSALIRTCTGAHGSYRTGDLSLRLSTKAWAPSLPRSSRSAASRSRWASDGRCATADG